jgi:hypothetical protein
VIRIRFATYANIPCWTVETMRPVHVVVDAIMAAMARAREFRHRFTNRT